MPEEKKNELCYGKGIQPETAKPKEDTYNTVDFYNLDTLKARTSALDLKTILSELNKLSYEGKAKHCFGFEEYSSRDDAKENITPHISKEFVLTLKEAGKIELADTKIHINHVKQLVSTKEPELV